MQNLYGNGGFFWWHGVVEDRNDPLLLGRCRVRILGYHNPSKVELPTEDLPWAFPLQSINSAAMNGIGAAPVGPVEGTWIMGFFRDGDECQEPIMMGTIGGVPQVDETLYEVRNPAAGDVTPVTTPDGDVYVKKGTGEVVTQATPTIPAEVVGPLAQDEVDRLLVAIAADESNSNFNSVDADGNIGAYRLSAAELVDLGLIKQGAFSQYKKAGLADYAIASTDFIEPEAAYTTMTDTKKSSFNFFVLSVATLWTQRAGNSASGFLSTSSIQNNAMTQSLKIHYRYLYRSEIVNNDTSKGDVAGYLTVCHYMGPGGAQDYHNGVVKSLEGISAATYFNLGFKAIGGTTGLSKSAGAAVQSPEQITTQTQPVAPPTPQTVASQKQNSDIVQTSPDVGFADPNKVYPKSQFIGEPDTNRLARHQKITNTIVGKKDATRRKGIPLALDAGTWDQPLVPYNTKYPYNHVFESESGHVIEYDDTAGNERLHQYHKAGTFVEIDANGTRVTKIVGDEFVILERNGYVFINGKLNVTIGGTANVKILGDCNLEVDGDLNSLIHNDATIGIAGDLKLAIGGEVDIASKGAMRIASETSVDVSSKGPVSLSSDVDVNVKGKDLKLEATSQASLKGGTKVALDAGTELGLQSGTKVAIKAGTELGLKASAAVKIAAGAILALDGAGLALLSGAAVSQSDPAEAEGAEGAAIANAGNAGAKKTVAEPTFPELLIPSRSEEFAYVLDSLTENGDSNSEAIKDVKAQAIADGTVEEEEFSKEPSAGTEDNKQVPARAAVDPGCGELGQRTDFPTSLKISNFFTLGMLSSGAVVTKVSLQSLHGLSKGEIVCNLHALATQVLDPIREHFPSMIITSGFRTPAHSKAVNSQHEYGNAADLQFCGVPKSGYLDIARWIRDNVPFDQLLLEYKSFGSGNPWIHVSYNTERLRADLRTMWNDRTYPEPTSHTLVDLSGGA